MPVLDLSPPARRPRPSVPPPLENGDRLDPEEFMRRYEAMPGVTAELLDGVVYIKNVKGSMASPVRHVDHAAPHADLALLLGTYRVRNPGVLGGDNGTVILAEDVRLQPDLYLMLAPDRGGRARVGDDGYVHGPPELVCEVSASTASVDAHAKADAYRRAGVAEYLLWRTDDRRIDWFALDGNAYRPLPQAGGLIESRAFPGLRLRVDALLAGDLAAVLAALDA